MKRFRTRGVRLMRATAGVVLAMAAPSAFGQCLDWSRSFDRPGNGLNGTVYALINFDDGGGPAVYAGGSFTQAGSVNARGVARWDGESWTPLGAGLGTVTALAVFDDGTGPALYAAGQFTRAGGAAGDRIARWDGAAWRDVGGGLTNNAWCMAVFDDGGGPQLYVAGDFWGAGGKFTDRVASWNGTSWRTWYGGPGARTGVAMTYDEARGETVVFGGRDGGYRADTLAYDGAGWTEVAPYGAGPAPRFNAEMTYDSLRQRCILFGGQREGWGGGVDFATWQWDGTAWSQIASAPVGITNRYDFRMVYDRARDRIVMFGGQDIGSSSVQFNETWEFNGTAWARMMPPTSPSPRRTFGLAYDEVRQRVVLFGGYNSAVGGLGDTWEYDGTTWTLITSSGPAPRYGQAMTYDPLAGRILMYDGTVDTGTVTETWAWDGAAWTQLDGGDPDWPARRGPMVFDSARGVPVQLTDKGTIWEFSGGAWTPRKLGGFSDTVYALAVHDDGAGPALYAGGNYLQVAGNPGCVARWDGSEWTGVGPFFTSHNPVNVRSLFSSDVEGTASLYAGGAFGWDGQEGNLARWDGSGWSLVGGVGASGAVYAMAEFDDGSGPALHVAGNFSGFGLQAAPGTAKFNGVQWHGLGFTRVTGRSNAAMAFDESRAEAILFGGTSNLGASGSALGDTWSWDGRTWTPRPGAGPSPRFGHAMAYDAARSRILLVGGGTAPASADSETWSWDGSSWSLLSAGFGADARFDHAMCYDADRDRVVLFGGRTASGALNDTWEFDGAAWTPIAAGGPSARSGHAMAYDQARQRTVLFGGRNAAGEFLIDTWEWDGTAWSAVTPGFGSNGRAGHTMVYDSAREKILVAGGRGTDVLGFSDVQQWDGTAWSSLYSASGSRWDHAAAYDTRLQSMVLVGGAFRPYGSDVTRDDTVMMLVRGASVTWPSVGEGGLPTRALLATAVSGSPTLLLGGDFTTAGPVASYRIAEWGFPCEPPMILDQPDGQTASYGTPILMSVRQTGRDYFAYRWTRNGERIVDEPGHIEGATTSDLAITNWDLADTGEYRALIDNPVGTAVSEPAVLAAACPADLNGDGLVDFGDYLEFLNLYDAGDLRVDFNQDGLVDFSDYLEFLNLYDAGC